MPFTVFLLVFVRKRDGDPRLDERQDDPVVISDLETDDSEDKSPAIYKPLINVTLIGKRENEISYPMAIYRAFRSPIVKCIHFSVSDNCQGFRISSHHDSLCFGGFDLC